MYVVPWRPWGCGCGVVTCPTCGGCGVIRPWARPVVPVLPVVPVPVTPRPLVPGFEPSRGGRRDRRAALA
jgi:hypothetical protein